MSRRQRRQVEQHASDLRSTTMVEATGLPSADGAAQPISAPHAAQVLDAIATLWAKVKPTMMERVMVIEDATLALMEGTLDDRARHEAEREAHKIAGSVGTFGFAAGSRTARELELLLGSPTKLAYEDALRLADLVVALERELESEPTPEEQEANLFQAEIQADSLFLLVVSADPDLTTGLEAEAASRGLQLQILPDVSRLPGGLDNPLPAAVILHLPDLSTHTDISVVSNALPGTPILVLTDRPSFADRGQVARLGVHSLLTRPQPPRKLFESALQAMLTTTVRHANLLVVDDDHEALMLLEAILTPAGMNLTLVDSADRFWTALEELSPDLVILDLDMPGVNGIDLCRMIRNDPRWNGLPILVLSVRNESSTIQEVFAAGADDYVTKPVVGPELITRISNRLERVRTRTAMAESDPLTGLASRHRAEMAYEQFLRIAARQSIPVSLGLVEIDRFTEIGDKHGQATADQLLRHVAYLMQQRFRSHDVAARWAGDRIVVGMFGASRDIAVLRLNQILQTFEDEVFIDDEGSAFTASFCAGIAQFPSDGKTVQELYRAADAVLCQAKETGPATVIASGWTTAPQLVDRSIDIVLVEDDEILASLLLHGLGTRGYATEWYRDGEEATLALTGSESRVQAQVVLLDVGLPSLDGFDVLRRLVESGVTQRTRVIMLTAHTSESEVLEALELGAFDHVAKPFSMPVLLQRIRQAMRH